MECNIPNDITIPWDAGPVKCRTFEEGAMLYVRGKMGRLEPLIL